MTVDEPVRSRRLIDLFSPRQVAVLGASANPGKFGGKAVANLLRHGYAGEVIPINPNRDEVQGLKAVPSILDVDGPIDVALVALPSGSVVEALLQCAHAGVGLAVVIAGGFAESGADGMARQAEVRGLAKSSGMRIIGPNGLGFANIWNRAIVVATGAFDLPTLRPGGISIVAQSGMIGFLSVLNRAQDAGVGFRILVSTGNEADIDAAEVLEAFLDDPQTDVLTAQLEAIRDPRRFESVASRAATVGKPIVLLKTGRTASGKAAASAHTAALTGADSMNSAIFRKYGIVRVLEIDDLWQVAELLSDQTRTAGDRLAVVTTSGGLGGISADIASSEGFTFPSLSSETVRELESLLPSEAVIGNPLDITGNFSGTGREREVFGKVIDIVGRDQNVDMLVFAPGVPNRDYDDAIGALPEVFARSPKPIAMLCIGGSIAREALSPLVGERRVPLFWRSTDCFHALRCLVDYQKFRSTGVYPVRPPSYGSTPIAASTGEGSMRLLDYEDVQSWLKEVGLSVPGEVLVDSSSAGVAAARNIGYPVAVKVIAPDLAHKSDAGGVVLSLEDDAAVAATADRLLAEYGGGARLLVQRMVPTGTELIIGYVRDPQFGGAVLLGLGGITAEVLGDVALRPVPANAGVVDQMIDELRGSRLLSGYRGWAPVNRVAVSTLISKVSEIAHRHSDIVAVDLNPVIVSTKTGEVEVVDVKIICSDQVEAKL